MPQKLPQIQTGLSLVQHCSIGLGLGSVSQHDLSGPATHVVLASSSNVPHLFPQMQIGFSVEQHSATGGDGSSIGAGGVSQQDPSAPGAQSSVTAASSRVPQLPPQMHAGAAAVQHSSMGGFTMGTTSQHEPNGPGVQVVAASSSAVPHLLPQMQIGFSAEQHLSTGGGPSSIGLGGM